MVQGIQNVSPLQQQQFGQSFTPQTQQSGIVSALLNQGVQLQQPVSPLEDLGGAALQIAGAFSEKKAAEKKKKEDEDFLARISKALSAPAAPGPSEFLPGGAGLAPVTSQDLAPIRTGTDPFDPQGLSREAVAREQELLRNTRFSNIGRR